MSWLSLFCSFSFQTATTVDPRTQTHRVHLASYLACSAAMLRAPRLGCDTLAKAKWSWNPLTLNWKCLMIVNRNRKYQLLCYRKVRLLLMRFSLPCFKRVAATVQQTHELRQRLISLDLCSSADGPNSTKNCQYQEVSRTLTAKQLGEMTTAVDSCEIPAPAVFIRGMLKTSGSQCGADLWSFGIHGS